MKGNGNWRKTVLLGICLGLMSVTIPRVAAHCQVPCGIYDDHARVEAMLENVATIEKAMKQITALSSKKDAQSQNQLIRWVITKENHAQKIIDIISDYFLTQRIKPSQKDYIERLKKHHAVIIAAMKCKQSVYPAKLAVLKKAVQALEPYYPEHHHHESGHK